MGNYKFIELCYCKYILTCNNKYIMLYGCKRGMPERDDFSVV